MSKKDVTVTLTPAQARVFHLVLSLVQNDPDWIDDVGGMRSWGSLDAGRARLLAAMQAANCPVNRP